VKLAINAQLSTGATLQEATHDLLSSAPQQAKDGWRLAHVSHAYGPVNGEDQWSIVAVYERVLEDERQPQEPVLDRAL
jgi:hypothetical protein